MTIDQSAFQNLNPVPTSLLVFGLPTLPPRGEVGRSSGRVGLFCVENCTNEQSALPSPGLKARLSQRESMVPCESLRHRCLVLKCALEGMSKSVVASSCQINKDTDLAE